MVRIPYAKWDKKEWKVYCNVLAIRINYRNSPLWDRDGCRTLADLIVFHPKVSDTQGSYKHTLCNSKRLETTQILTYKGAYTQWSIVSEKSKVQKCVEYAIII